MTYQRLPYDDAASTEQMSADARKAAAVVAALRRPAPSIRYEDFPREVPKPTIEVSEAAARVAAALQLHLD
jgi:hypothetical protein